MPKKKRSQLNFPTKTQRMKRIAKALAKRRLEQESLNFRNQGTDPPCSIFKDLHEKKSGLSVHQNVKPFILNKCDVIESSNSIQSDVYNSVKIEQTEEVSVGSTVLYQPKYVDYRNVIDEQYTCGSGSSCSEEDPARLSVYQNVKPFIHNKCDVIESSNSIQSDVCNSVKIEQTEEVSVGSTVLYQPKYVHYRNVIDEQYTCGSGSSCSEEVPARLSVYQNDIHYKCDVIESSNSIQSDVCNSVKIEQTEEVSVGSTVLYQPKYIVDGNYIYEEFTYKSDDNSFKEDPTNSFARVEKDESTMSNEKGKCLPILMHSTIEKDLLHNKSANFNQEVIKKSDPKLIILLVDKVDNERKDKCQCCRYVCCSETILKMHIESIDCYSNNYRCHLCDFVCDLKSKLKDHIGAVHLELHTFKCTSKKSSFKAKGYKPVLSNGELKFVCNDCNYKTILKAHMLVHLKSKQRAMKTFKCIYCDFNSAQYRSWKNHMDCVHFKVNNYVIKI